MVELGRGSGVLELAHPCTGNLVSQLVAADLRAHSRPRFSLLASCQGTRHGRHGSGVLELGLVSAMVAADVQVGGGAREAAGTRVLVTHAAGLRA